VLADGANGHPPIGFAGVSSGGGGGVLWLRAPTVAISGTVRAKGGDYVASARGADGTVVIDADCRTGEGVIYPEPTVGTFSGAAGVAVDDAYTTDEDTTLSVPAAGVLANDCGSSLSAVLVTGASHGAVSLQSDGLFDYTPASDWHGTDSLTYALSAGGVASGTATVTITVVSVNDAPVAAADAYTAQSGAALTVQSVLGVLANDSDVDGDPLTAALATNVAHGTLSLAPDGSFTYTSEPGFVGTDSFTYVASDGATSSATTTATINVTPPPSDLSATVQPPINADGTSVFAAKRGVVPVKFALHTGDGSATCDPPAATITVTRTGSGNATSVDEAVYTTPADSGSAFRVTGCQYIYNLDTKALGTGTYRVTILVNGHELGATTFAVK
jgi:hypothetical protein